VLTQAWDKEEISNNTDVDQILVILFVRVLYLHFSDAAFEFSIPQGLQLLAGVKRSVSRHVATPPVLVSSMSFDPAGRRRKFDLRRPPGSASIIVSVPGVSLRV
jgi:hypothetical protein